MTSVQENAESGLDKTWLNGSGRPGWNCDGKIDANAHWVCLRQPQLCCRQEPPDPGPDNVCQGSGLPYVQKCRFQLTTGVMIPRIRPRHDQAVASGLRMRRTARIFALDRNTQFASESAVNRALPEARAVDTVGANSACLAHRALIGITRGHRRSSDWASPADVRAEKD